MNQALLKQTAQRLIEELNKYAPSDTDAAKLRRSLLGCIQEALDGRMQTPVPWQQIPGDRLLDESELRQYPGLERAYAHFKIQATGGPPSALIALRKKMGEAE